MTDELIQVSDRAEIHQYPLAPGERLNGFFFFPFEHNRWWMSDMRLHGSYRARALYIDVLTISYQGTPIGTLPNSIEAVAKMCGIAESELRAACQERFSPLHRFQPYLCGNQVRLAHDFVVSQILEAVARRADNAAKSEAANRRKRLERLRNKVVHYSAELAMNALAIEWMDEWLLDANVTSRTPAKIEAAIGAWHDASFQRPGGVLKVSRGQFSQKS